LFSYDAAGDITSLTPPGQPAHGFNYNSLGDVQNYAAPSLRSGPGQTAYAYNSDDQLTQITNPDGSSLSLGYDRAGRLSTVTSAQGTESIAYDANTGNLKTVTAPGGESVTSGYDGGLLTDLTAEGDVAGSVHYSYDSNFNLASESVNGGNTAAFAYDADGLLTQAGDLKLNLEPQNGLQVGSTLGGVTDSITYDGFSEPATYQAAFGGTTLYAIAVVYNGDGQVTQRTETVGGATRTFAYAYDSAARLTQVQEDGIVTAQYGYDANGNRTSFSGPGGSVSGSYNDKDQLLSYGTNTYTYSAEGFLTTKTDTATGQTTAYTYDGLGNLMTVTLPDGTRIDYLIDGYGDHIGKRVNGVLRQGFVYGLEQGPVAELDSNGKLVSRFVYGTNDVVPDYMVKDGETYRIVTDEQGSSRLVVDAKTGQVVQQMDCDAFGNVIRDTNPGFQPFGFAGGLYDRDTGFTHFGARDYDAATGRWTAKDPLLFNGLDSNLYEYGFDDPINLHDANGLAPDSTVAPIPLGDGWGARIDGPWQGNNSYEIHVYNPQTNEVGVLGPNGWIAKHGKDGSAPRLPDNVAKTLNGVDIKKQRQLGLCPDKRQPFARQRSRQNFRRILGRLGVIGLGITAAEVLNSQDPVEAAAEHAYRDPIESFFGSQPAY
jgi:RHS repeat-associated protein